MTKKKTTKATQQAAAPPQPPSRQLTEAERALDYYAKPDHFKPLAGLDMRSEQVEQALEGATASSATSRMIATAKSIEERVKQIDDVRVGIGNDISFDPATRFLKRTELQSTAIRLLEKSINDTGKLTTEYINGMGEKMTDSWKEIGPPMSMKPAEIRSHILGMDGDEQAAFVSAAMKANDGSVVNTVLTTPSFMLSVKSFDVDRLTREAHTKFCPESLAERDRLLKGLERFTKQARAALSTYQINELDRGHLERATELREQAVSQAAALSGEA